MVLFAGASHQNINYCLFVTNRMARNEGGRTAKIQTCLWSFSSISIEMCCVKSLFAELWAWVSWPSDLYFCQKIHQCIYLLPLSS